MVFSINAGNTRRLVIRLVALILVICFSSTVFAQDTLRIKLPKIDKKSPDYLLGKSDGKEDADQYYNARRWRTGGFVGGLFLGLAGTVVTLGISQLETSVPNKDELIFLKAKTPDYSSGYCSGYLRKAQTKRIGPVLVGGIIGSIFSGAIVYVIVKARQKPERY